MKKLSAESAGKIKKSILFIILIAGVLIAVFSLSKCSENTAFSEDRTYVYKSAIMHFYNDKDRFLILGEKSTEEWINTRAGLKQMYFEFKKNNACYKPEENAVNYKMYYDYKDDEIKVYDKKGGELLYEFQISMYEITGKFYIFEDYQGFSGKSYIEITFELSY